MSEELTSGGAPRKRKRKRSGSGGASGGASARGGSAQSRTGQFRNAQSRSAQPRGERSYGDRSRSENPRSERRTDQPRSERRTSSARFDGKTSIQRAAERAVTHSEDKRGGGGVTKRSASGRERNRRSMGERSMSAAAPSQRARTADSARLVAYETLLAVADKDAYANLVLPKLIRSHRLDARDAGFATELAYGTLRAQGTYDAIISRCVDRPLEKIDSHALLVLRMGTHQLLGMRVPPHAALNQSVALAREVLGSGPSGFVNAVLRRVSERSRDQWLSLLSDEAKDQLERQSLEFSHPVWMVRSLRQALAAHGRTPGEIEELLAADNAAPVVNLVALPGLGSLDEALDKGAEPGALVEGSALYSSGDLARLEGVRAGTVRAQDVGSQLVARALAAAPLEGSDSAWLDLCAGPGGKAALLAALGAQRGAALVANEAAPHRARLVQNSLEPIASESYTVLTGDGREIAATLKSAKSLPVGIAPDQLFDRVMVDVPCSGMGALRRRPEARWRKSPRDIADLLPLQRELLQAAVQATRPGGVIAYVTCSPHAAETQNIVAEMLESGQVQLMNSAAVLESVALQDNGVSALSGEKSAGFTPEIKQPKGAATPVLGEGASTVQLWPHVHGTDAMFMALLRKI